MITKKIKEYSNRQRIDINKSDGFTRGEDVVIIPVQKFDEIKQNILDLQSNLSAKDNEIQLLKNQEQNLKEIIEDVTAPIYERHKKEMENKDNQIKQLENQIKALQRIASQYNIQMSGLSAIDVVFRKKHKDLIDDFNNNIWIVNQDNQVEDVDLKKLPGNDDQEQ